MGMQRRLVKVLDSTMRMELLATRDEKRVWYCELLRPYRLDTPFSGEPYVCILFANDGSITSEEQVALSEQIVCTGCRYAVCAGHGCSRWDDSIDLASVVIEEQSSPPDDTLVMTSWHEGDSVHEIVHFGLDLTAFSEQKFRRYLVLFVGPHDALCEEVKKAVQSLWNENGLA